MGEVMLQFSMPGELIRLKEYGDGGTRSLLVGFGFGEMK